MNVDLAIWLAGSIVLFIIGIYGLVSQKDAIRLVIAIEIMVTAANSAFIGIAYLLNKTVDPLGQTYAILSLAVGGGVIGVALSIVKASYEKGKTSSTTHWKKLRW
jgi:NADH:ubiquinone oxidoreductase subunit K